MRAMIAALVAGLAGTAVGQEVVREGGASEALVVRCGRLLSVPGHEALGEHTLVIVDGVVVRVLEGLTGPETAPAGSRVEVLDLSGFFVLPGLIDCHVHMTSQQSRDMRLRAVTESDADRALAGSVYARRTVEAGFTTVRDVGSTGDAAFALRDAIESGLVVGPRMLVAGEGISATGGHGDGTLGYRDDLFDAPGPMDGVADGADACRQAVRHQVKRGADVIKLTATGGVLSNTAAGLERQFFDDELRAIVETAHLLGRRVAAHAHGAEGIKAALRAGVDSIEHGTYLDGEAIGLFVERGAFLVPTVHAGKFVGERALEAGYFPDAVAAKAMEVGPRIQDALRRAHAGGVRIAFGTDVGVGEHGTNAMEFVYMTEAGMSASEAIVAATINAAELCALRGEVGTLEPGRAADLIAVSASPLADVRELLDVDAVVRAGRVIVRPE